MQKISNLKKEINRKFSCYSCGDHFFRADSEPWKILCYSCYQAEKSARDEQIKIEISKLDLREIMEREGIKLAPAGADRMKCSCPFHSEKTASFFLYNQKTYHCFGCGQSGDAISFIRAYKGLSFPGALSYLGIAAEGAGSINPEIYQKALNSRKAKARLAYFQTWINQYASEIGWLILACHDAIRNLKIDDFETAAPILQQLSILEYWHEIAAAGDPESKFYLFVEKIKNKGVI